MRDTYIWVMSMKRKKTGMGFTILAVAVLFVMITYARTGLESRDNELKVKKAELERQIKDLESDKEQIESYR